jgi:GNAT superfamily N-acetyltransferase
MITFRDADAADADAVATLHADSWRRHYRGAYSDAFLDGEVAANRLAYWTALFAARPDSATILAEQDRRLVGFVHVVFDSDPRWGSLVDNLHVVHDAKRTGVGTRLVSLAAAEVVRHARDGGLHLWVLEQNTAAQQFYRRLGGVRVETAYASAPVGDPANLVGTPRKYRMAWPDAAAVSGSRSAP